MYLYGMGKIRKSDYIAKYGEEAWKQHALKIKEQSKKYYERHKASINEKQKEYYALHKKEASDKAKEYYQKNKEHLIQKAKEYYESHKVLKERDIEQSKENRRQYLIEYRKTNCEKAKAYHKQYNPTYQKKVQDSKYLKANSYVCHYRWADKESELEGFNLTREWIIENIFSSKCVYCGDNDWRHLGCDRIDNEKAHRIDNVVCSCGICNMERQRKRMSVKEFVEYRRTHPRDLIPQKLQEVVEVNGKKVIRKVKETA